MQFIDECVRPLATLVILGQLVINSWYHFITDGFLKL